MLLSKCAVSDSKKSKCIKEQEANNSLSSLETKTHLSKTFFSKSSFYICLDLHIVLVDHLEK